MGCSMKKKERKNGGKSIRFFEIFTSLQAKKEWNSPQILDLLLFYLAL